jgi:hypothetical protein
MNGYIISPIGIVVIAVYSFLILIITFFISRLLLRFRWKWMVLAPPTITLLSLPWVEEAWISWHFNEACKDAGVTVSRQVEVEGYLDALSPKEKRHVKVGSHLVPQPVDFEQQGYVYYEEALIEGGATRVEREGDRLIASIFEKPKSRYVLKRHYQPGPGIYEELIGWKLQKIERQIIDSQTGEVLGRDRTIKRVLPSHEALIAGLFGPPIVMCPGPNVKPFVPQLPFPQAVLKPISKK